MIIILCNFAPNSKYYFNNFFFAMHNIIIMSNNECLKRNHIKTKFIAFEYHVLKEYQLMWY